MISQFRIEASDIWTSTFQDEMQQILRGAARGRHALRSARMFGSKNVLGVGPPPRFVGNSLNEVADQLITASSKATACQARSGAEFRSHAKSPNTRTTHLAASATAFRISSAAEPSDFPRFNNRRATPMKAPPAIRDKTDFGAQDYE
jgi:hypothetical protein